MKKYKLEGPFHKILLEKLEGFRCEFSDYLGDFTVRIQAEDAKRVFTILKGDSSLAFDQMIDLTCVDYLNENRTPRFEMVYHFYSFSTKFRLRVKFGLPAENPATDTVSDIWLAGEWYERECYDLFGIDFRGHPDLRRIIMWEGFDGHPLRKDYPITREQPLLDLKDSPERHNYMDKHLF